MTKTTEITRLDINRAEDNKIKNGSMELNGKTIYGFFTKECFYYSIANHYFKVTK